jgi:hypothetical protein
VPVQVVLQFPPHFLVGRPFKVTPPPVDKIKHKKPWLHISRDGQYDATESLLRFVSDHGIKILNVAGPRASKEPSDCCFRKESAWRGIFSATRFMLGRPVEG